MWEVIVQVKSVILLLMLMPLVLDTSGEVIVMITVSSYSETRPFICSVYKCRTLALAHCMDMSLTWL